MSEEITRRQLLERGLALPPFAAVAAGAALAFADASAAAERAPTPALSEGPYFTPGSPRRRSIVPPGAPGTRLRLTGRVLTTTGRPVPGARVDFWQTDARGVYDNDGFAFRGHQLTDSAGRYALETVVPGVYPRRTRHIHVKVRAPGRPELTTQLFFPGVPQNRTDSIFLAACLVRGWRLVDGKRLARFDFVLTA